MKNVSLVLISLSIFICGPVIFAASDQSYQQLIRGPYFWQEKPKVYSEMRLQRSVPVSATKSDKGWSFKGAGIVNAPKGFTFDKAKDLNQLKELKEHFTNIAVSSDGRNINLGVRFLGQERVIEVKTKIMPSDGSLGLTFEVTGGLLKGLYGVLFVKDVERRKGEAVAPETCEVGLITSLTENSFWVPGFIFGLGAEGIMRHVAISLRDLVEKDYKNQQNLQSK